MALGAVAVGLVALSGGDGSDPRTPVGLRGLPAAFFGVAVVAGGGGVAAVDAYGNVVDLRTPGPAGRARVAVSAKRQAAGTVAAGEASVARAGRGGGGWLPLWRADSIRQGYLRGSNVLRTVARFGGRRFELIEAIDGTGLGCLAGKGLRLGSEPCSLPRARIERAVRGDRRWLARARVLGGAAPPWARAMYRRSLLVLRALSDRRSGAVAAGARDGWAYVWPRDAATVAVAFAAAGYRAEARRAARFLLGLDLGAAARFRGTGAPVPGRGPQGDAAGWVAVAARAAGLSGAGTALGRRPWRDRADYQEGDRGDRLANAIASVAHGGDAARRSMGGQNRLGAVLPFVTGRGLVRDAGEPGSGLDSAAAWAVRPFPIPALRPAVRRTLLRLVADRGSRYGIVPSERWQGGEDPWTAATAWTAWALATLARGDGAAARRDGARRAALSLLAALRRAATPLGLLPERVDARTGRPASTTPLAWSHAFAILALRAAWPPR